MSDLIHATCPSKVGQLCSALVFVWFLFMLSLAAVSGGYSLVVVLWLLLLRITGSTAWAWGVGAHGLSCLRHVESSQTTDRIRVPCIGMQILNHWTTREALCIVFTLGTRLVKPLLFWMLPIATAEGKVIYGGSQSVQKVTYIIFSHISLTKVSHTTKTSPRRSSKCSET